MTAKITLELKGEHSNQVESMYHEIVKQIDDANRYGVDVTVRRVDPESDHTEGFDG